MRMASSPAHVVAVSMRLAFGFWPSGANSDSEVIQSVSMNPLRSNQASGFWVKRLLRKSSASV